MRRRTIYATLAGIAGSVPLFGLPLLIGGCGSSGTVDVTATTGRAALTIRWPEHGDSRLIPFAANSIRVRVLKGASELGTALLVRPANGGLASANFDRLPIGDVSIDATAYPGNDGSGVGQASAQTTVTIVAGQTVPVALTLASTIDKVEVTPSPVALNSGQTAQLTATAKNAAGEVVLTQGATIEWISKNASVATVGPGGLVRAVASGSAVIEAKETESGKVGTVTVQVGQSSSGNVKCDPATGHCYEKITEPTRRTFAELRADAESRTYQGLRGHLATITSASEQAFVQANVNPVRATIGAYQDRAASNYSEPGGGWRWVTGEAWSYTLWRGGEPNNAGGVEDYHNYFGDGTWNDAADRDWDAYIVEYEAGTPGSGGGNGGGREWRW